MKWPIITAVILATLMIVPAEAFERQIDHQLAEVKTTMQRDMVAGIRQASRLIYQMSHESPGSAGTRMNTAAIERLVAEAYLRLGQITEAEHLINAAEKEVRAQSPRSELLAEILLTKGGVLAARESYDAALGSYQAAYRIFTIGKADRGKSVALVYIASLYIDARDWESALRYLEQAQDSVGDDLALANAIRNNRGLVFHADGRYEAAEKEMRQALLIAQRMGNSDLEAQMWRNLARNAVEMNRLSTADTLIRRALLLTADEATTQSQLLAISADVALRRGQIQVAASLVDRAFRGVDIATTAFVFRDAHNTAYRTYQALGQPAKALAHLVALRRLNDEATKLATTTGAALMRARFDFANQELRIANLRAEELRRDVAAGEARARAARTVFTIAATATAIIIALLACALFAIRRSRDKVRAANDGLAVTNAALGQALAAKTEFLATTSHEIRTPLNGILGMTQVMLADRGLAADVRDRLGVVHGAGVTMRALVDDILDVAKMEAGRLTVEAAEFDLAAVLRDATAMWREQARTREIGFAVDVAAAPRALIGDAARVRQIVFNLLSNAMKFTSDGEVALKVTVAADRQTLSIAVSDTGIGIAADQRTAVFEPFRQADASTTRRFGGSGLGLAICRNLARAMGGEIGLDSVQGQGSTFTVTLPLVETGALDAGPCAELPVHSDALLLVDRNPIARGMWRRLFDPHTAQIAFADDADDARAILHCGGITRMLVDEAAVGTQAAGLIAAAAGLGVRTWLLRPAGAAEWTGAATAGVLVKPVRGMAVVAALFDEAGDEPLVCRAA